MQHHEMSDLTSPKQRLIPFLSFQGCAEEAMNFYASILPNAKIETLIRFEQGEDGDEGKVLFGELSFSNQRLMFLDIKSGLECPRFSWATSFYFECRDECEFDAVFNGLSQGGIVMSGPDTLLHFHKVAWITDKFGVAWQPVLKSPQS